MDLGFAAIIVTVFLIGSLLGHSLGYARATQIGVLKADREFRSGRAYGWDEGYAIGVADERRATEADLPEWRNPNRINPYLDDRREYIASQEDQK